MTGDGGPAALIGRLLATEDETARHALLRAALAVGEAEVLLRDLHAEADRQLRRDPHAAARLAGAMVAGAGWTGRPDLAALGLLVGGDAVRLLGRYAESVHRYEEARLVFQSSGDEVGWARTFIGWVISCHYLGRGKEALEALPAARATLERHGEQMRMVAIDFNAAYVAWRLGRYAEALEGYDRAQAALELMGPAEERRVAWVKGNKALIFTLLGDFDSALTLHGQARVIFERVGETNSVMRTDQFVADVHAGRGDYGRALHLYGEVLAALEAAGLEIDGAWVAMSMVECNLSLGRVEEALASAEEMLVRFERHGTPTEAAQARLAAALALRRLGDDGRALALLDEAAAVFERTGLSAQGGQVALHRAGLLLDDGDWPAALAEAGRAEALFEERGLVVRAAQAALARARAALALGDLAVAGEATGQALAVAEARGVAPLAHEGHHLRARLARARGDVPGALASFAAAAEALDRVQRRLPFALRGALLDDTLAVYDDAVDACLAAGEPAAALAYLERAKSRALVDYLAARPALRPRPRDPADAPLLDEVSRLRAEHHWFMTRLYGDGLERPGADAAGPADSAAEAATLEAGIADRERRIGRLLERLALRGAAGSEVDTAGAAPVLPALDAETVLLEYRLSETGSQAFVVTVDGVTVVPLPTPPATIRRQVALWGAGLERAAVSLGAGEPPAASARALRALLGALYEELLRPVETHLTGRRRLIVIPHGPTHAVPFHALHDGRRHLLERLEVTACPSATLLRLCQARPRRPTAGALVLAYSDGGRLPAVLDEARAVAALLPGACHLEGAATRSSLAAAGDHAVLHLAAHGDARLDNPTFAHIQLADGHLTTADIFGLDLAGALVTLSACETGRGLVGGGDEVIGLSRGFLSAGAASLVQSLWRVEDAATARLMVAFYRALRDGAPTGAALRAAQLSLLDERDAHPYYWAAFQLIGDDGPLTGAAPTGR